MLLISLIFLLLGPISLSIWPAFIYMAYCFQWKYQPGRIYIKYGFEVKFKWTTIPVSDIKRKLELVSDDDKVKLEEMLLYRKRGFYSLFYIFGVVAFFALIISVVNVARA